MQTTLQTEIVKLLASNGTEEMVQFFAFVSEAGYAYRYNHQEEFEKEFGHLGERVLKRAQKPYVY